MKEFADFTKRTAEEQHIREQEREILNSLPGFSRLSEKQRRYILASLYIQQRAERGTDPVSASRIQGMPDMLEQFAPGRAYIRSGTLPPNAGSATANKYFLSQLYIMREYCHKAVATLEEYREKRDQPVQWHEADQISSYSDLEELIALAGKKDEPLVLEIWLGTPDGEGSVPVHTSLILGKNEAGEYMVWEKSGYHMPFQVVSLKQVYDAYVEFELGPVEGWRVRPLLV